MIVGKTYYLTREEDNSQVDFKVAAKNRVEIEITENGQVTRVEKNIDDAIEYWLMLQNAGFEACQEEDLPIVLIEE